MSESEIRLSGLGVSDGVVIGKACLYDTFQETKETKDDKINIEEQLIILNNAYKIAYEELEEIKNKAKGSHGESEAEIIMVQQELLKDEELLSEIITTIEKSQYSAQKAVKEVIEHYINIFNNMKDEYLSQRAIDIKDLGTRLINIITGVKRNKLTDINQKIILVSNDLTPSDTIQINKENILALITGMGGNTSHTAILAKSMGIPTVVGLGENIKKINNEELIIVDGKAGQCIINPNKETVNYYNHQIKIKKDEDELLKKFVKKPAMTKDGHLVQLVANIGTLDELDNALKNGAQGVGLFRTEFIFMNSTYMPTEHEQYEIYKETAMKMNDKPVIIRTFDIGGDKNIPYIPLPKENNPFLGYRAIRIALDQKEILSTQLRAILRASVYGNLKIMFPMISNLQELRMAKKIFEDVKLQLSKEGIPYNYKIELGIMVEIPSVAILAEQFAKEVDFFSIGTNDLVQYTLAVDRMNQNVAHLYDYFNPAVISLIKKTIEAAQKEGKWVGMCGEMAGDPLATPLLLGLGLDEWSMNTNSINIIKKILATMDSSRCKEIADQARKLQTSEEIREMMQKINY